MCTWYKLKTKLQKHVAAGEKYNTAFQLKIMNSLPKSSVTWLNKLNAKKYSQISTPLRCICKNQTNKAVPHLSRLSISRFKCSSRRIWSEDRSRTFWWRSCSSRFMSSAKRTDDFFPRRRCLVFGDPLYSESLCKQQQYSSHSLAYSTLCSCITIIRCL